MDSLEKVLSLGLFNIGYSLLDGATGGALGGVVKTFEERKKYIKDVNESLYMIHVKTFIETINIDKSQWDCFVESHPEQSKIGIEALAVLKHVTSEQQAKMIGLALNLKAKNLITFQEYNKYQYIILRMNSYLLELLEEINENKIEPNNGLKGVSVGDTFVNLELISFGFLKERVDPVFSDAYPNFHDYKYIVTEEFFKFYKLFVKQE